MELPQGPAAIDLLAGNELEPLTKASAMLQKILKNIALNDGEAKFRTIKTTNPTFNANVWSVPGGQEFLFSVGFLVEDGAITLPEPPPRVGELMDTPLMRAVTQLQQLEVWKRKQPTAEELRQQELAREQQKKEKEAMEKDAMEKEVSNAKMAQVAFDEIRREKRKAQVLSGDLTANPPEELELAIETLQKVLQNILDHPEEEKYRKLKPSNPTFRRNVWDVIGGEDFLKKVGFEVVMVDGLEVLILPSQASLNTLKTSMDSLKEMQEANLKRLQELRQKQNEENRENMRRLKESLKKDVMKSLGMVQVGDVARADPRSSSSASPSSSSTGPVQRPELQQQMLQRFMGRSKGSATSQQEVELRALHLVEDTAALMEFYSRLSGEASYVAQWKVEKQRLYAKYKEDKDIEYLMEVKEEWEEKLQTLKRKKGKTILDTVGGEGGARAQASSSSSSSSSSAGAGSKGMDVDDKEIEKRFKKMQNKK